MKMTENVMEQAAGSDLEVSEGQLVWYNERKGYGFVRIGDEEDVFVHSRVLNDCGFHSLVQGQKLLVKVDSSSRGLQVNSVRLLSD